MKVLFAGLLLMGATAFAGESEYYNFSAPMIEEITLNDGFEINNERDFQSCDNKGRVMADAPVNPIDAIDTADVIIDKIINLGKKVWAVIELGRPVTDIRVDTANALPKGVLCWSDLAGWSPTQSKAFRITYTNGFGGQVVNFAFRVVYTTGGSYKGQGKYITNATIIPSQVEVAWGYTFSAETEIPTVYNAGTATEPLAGMNLNMKWAVKTVMKTDLRTESFVVGGDGSFKRLD